MTANSSSSSSYACTRVQRRSTVFDTVLIEERPGFIAASFEGAGVRALFANEAGGHRWQRIPPTEKRGRVQTSTVTVAVLDPDAAGGVDVREQDVEITTARGSGPGGQKRNKTESCVIATHKPSGLTVRIDNERSQSQNRRLAMQVLRARLTAADEDKRVRETNDLRRQQVGSGMRGDKIRTLRVRDNLVTDHRTSKKWRLDAWLRGEW